MRPILFKIFGFPVYAYGFMIMLGFMMAMNVAVNRFRSRGLNYNLVFDFGLVTMLSGIIGARIFFVIQFHEQFIGDARVFNIFDGLSLLGLVLGVLVALACYRNPSGAFTIFLGFIGLIFIRYQGWNTRSPGHYHPVDLVFLALVLYQLGINLKQLKQNLWPLAWPRSCYLAVLLVVAALLGGRIVYLSLYAGNYSWRMFMIWRGGIVFYGGFILGTAAAMIFMRYHQLPVLKVSDALAPSVALGIAFTRFGCFLNGCCFGGPCAADAPLAVIFPPHSLPSLRIYLHGLQEGLARYYPQIGPPPYNFKALPPEIYERIFHQHIYATQLISSLNAFVIFLILSWFYRRRKHDGEVLLMFGICYSIGRFLIELLRNDTAPILGTGLKAGQAVSVPLFCLCLGLFIFLRIRPYIFNKAKGQ